MIAQVETVIQENGAQFGAVYVSTHRSSARLGAYSLVPVHLALDQVLWSSSLVLKVIVASYGRKSVARYLLFLFRTR